MYNIIYNSKTANVDYNFTNVCFNSELQEKFMDVWKYQ